MEDNFFILLDIENVGLRRMSVKTLSELDFSIYIMLQPKIPEGRHEPLESHLILFDRVRADYFPKSYCRVYKDYFKDSSFVYFNKEKIYVQNMQILSMDPEKFDAQKFKSYVLFVYIGFINKIALSSKKKLKKAS